jgi:hypothetical protein
MLSPFMSFAQQTQNKSKGKISLTISMFLCQNSFHKFLCVVLYDKATFISSRKSFIATSPTQKKAKHKIDLN